jgi:hypothetical protein
MLPSCGAESEPALGEAETFDWSDQPIRFSPPPEGWRRERYQQGGLEGIRFVKQRSVGEGIHVTEHYSLGDRDRCGELQDLAGSLDDLDRWNFERKLQGLRLYAEPPINRREAELAAQVNASMDRARAAFRAGDTATVRREITLALEQASWIRYSLDEVVDRVMFSTEGHPNPERLEISEPVSRTVGGEPALQVDYTMDHRNRTYLGREVYVAHNNRLFVAGFIGLEENLALFDRVVSTISFPPGVCEH